MKKGELANHIIGVLEIRHAQVMFKYRQYKEKIPNRTETKISEKTAGYFNHSFEIARGYKRLTLDSLGDPLATK